MGDHFFLTLTSSLICFKLWQEYDLTSVKVFIHWLHYKNVAACGNVKRSVSLSGYLENQGIVLGAPWTPVYVRLESVAEEGCCHQRRCGWSLPHTPGLRSELQCPSSPARMSHECTPLRAFTCLRAHVPPFSLFVPFSRLPALPLSPAVSLWQSLGPCYTSVTASSASHTQAPVCLYPCDF